MKKEDKKLPIFLKGVLMGLCDLIPGISGGTIAFITGIYERLISAISHITLQNKFLFWKSIFTKDKKTRNKIFKNLDIKFLGLLFGGIFTSIILGSHLISYLLENYYVYLLSFFIGLILVSSKIIYKSIKIHNIQNVSFAFIGFLGGFSLLFISPKEVIDPSWMYVVLGGFLAIFALFLPGVSGSFVLLVMGLYEHIINSVKNFIIGWKTLLLFGIGAIFGVQVISKLIKYLFEKDKCKTLYVLLGIVLGSLIIPIMRINEKIIEPSLLIFLGIIICFIFGSIFGYYIEKMGK